MLCLSMFDDILKDLNSRECFKSFLKTEYTEENLEFWCAVEQYRKIESNSCEKLIQCEQIYNEFIAEYSNQQISIPHNIYQQTQHNFNNKQLDTIFDEAQSSIYKLMERDSFERFKNSTFYS